MMECKHLAQIRHTNSRYLWRKDHFCSQCGKQLFVTRHPIRFLRYVLGLDVL